MIDPLVELARIFATFPDAGKTARQNLKALLKLVEPENRTEGDSLEQRVTIRIREQANGHDQAQKRPVR